MIVDFNTLCTMARLKSKAGVRNWLNRNHIRYLVGADGAPCTTLDTIDLAMGPKNLSEPNFSALITRPRKGAKPKGS